MFHWRSHTVESVMLTLFGHKIGSMIRNIRWFLGKLFGSIYTLNTSDETKNHCQECWQTKCCSLSKNDVCIIYLCRHEIAGVVTEVGSDVKGFKVGDHVGVGTYVNSCRDCENCNSSLENHCPRSVYTFNGIDTDGTVTKGGYSTHIVVHERYGSTTLTDCSNKILWYWWKKLVLEMKCYIVLL